MKELVVGALIDVVGRLLGVIERRVNRPSPEDVTEAQLDALLRKAAKRKDIH